MAWQGNVSEQVADEFYEAARPGRDAQRVRDLLALREARLELVTHYLQRGLFRLPSEPVRPRYAA